MSFIFDPLQHFFHRVDSLTCPVFLCLNHPARNPEERRAKSCIVQFVVGSLFANCCVNYSYLSSCLLRLDQDLWQVLHRPDAAYFKQHGGEAGRRSSQEIHLVWDFIFLQVVGDCRHTQAGGYAQVSHSLAKHTVSPLKSEVFDEISLMPIGLP